MHCDWKRSKLISLNNLHAHTQPDLFLFHHSQFFLLGLLKEQLRVVRKRSPESKALWYRHRSPARRFNHSEARVASRRGHRHQQLTVCIPGSRQYQGQRYTSASYIHLNYRESPGKKQAGDIL